MNGQRGLTADLLRAMAQEFGAGPRYVETVIEPWLASVPPTATVLVCEPPAKMPEDVKRLYWVIDDGRLLGAIEEHWTFPFLRLKIWRR